MKRGTVYLRDEPAATPGKAFGVPAESVREELSRFSAKQASVEAAINSSRLSSAAKERYLDKFHDRLGAIKL